MSISLFVDASYNSLTAVNLFLYQRAAVPLLSARGGPLESVFLANSRSYDSGKKGKVMRKTGACASGHHAPHCSTSTVCAGDHHAAPFSLTPLLRRPATRPPLQRTSLLPPLHLNLRGLWRGGLCVSPVLHGWCTVWVSKAWLPQCPSTSCMRCTVSGFAFYPR